MTTIIGALIEARDELRIQKLRVLLSLVGVAAAVMAMTAVLAIGQMVAQAQREMMEQWAGRDTTLEVWVSPENPEETDVMEAMTEYVDRFHIDYSTRTINTWGEFTTRAGAASGEIRAVDPGYNVIRPVTMTAGEWFGPGDTQRLAPAAIVNETMMRRAGVPADLSEQPNLSLTMSDGTQQSFVVTGVTKDENPIEWQEPLVYVLVDSYFNLLPEEEQQWTQPGLTIWVDPADADTAQSVTRSYFQQVAGENGWVDVYSNNFGGELDEFNQMFQAVVLGVGTVVLAIGAISLVNISMVTVQQRIREIGIRRAFGATSGRVFFSIMMESVVATFAAGVVGVFLAVIIVTRLPVLQWLGMDYITNVPPFPLSAAITGVVIATVIGALAGLIPGLVATRIKPIEAMRAA
ncbi:putative ABC transport system permease protein [Ruaniaceae bacterium KH17]|nr:putative ABC transport system permease protein [Ruaniaceae bacterium KH17]